MARLHKIPPFTGTRDGICIYHMKRSFFVRTASSLTAERVKKDPAFAETRRNSGLLSRAAKINAGVYKKINGKNKNPVNVPVTNRGRYALFSLQLNLQR